MLWLLLSLLRSDPARAVVGPLRVRFDFSHPLLYSMDDAARDLYQNTVLPEAADYVGRALSVERIEGPLRLARKCSSRGNNDHCYLRMDNASKLQKATYLRLWRARSWLIDFRRREIHRKYLMHVPLVNKTMDSLSVDMLPPIVALVVAAAVFVFVFPLVSVFVDLITFRPNLDCVEVVRVGMCEYYGFGPQARGALFDPSSL